MSRAEHGLTVRQYSARTAVHLAASFIVLAALSTVEGFALERPRLVEDLSPDPQVRGSYPGEMHRLGGRVLFAASDPLHGWELRALNDDLSDLELLVDATPGTVSSTVRFVAEFDGALAYLIGDVYRPRMYVTDGTREGTRLVRASDGSALLPEWLSGEPPAFAVAGQRLVFAGSSATSLQRTLWAMSADGQATILRALPEATDPFSGSWFAELRAVGSSVFFQEVDSLYRARVWRTDGTAEGTRSVGDEFEGQGYQTAATAERYFFLGWGPAGETLYSTDGSPTGTRALRSWESEWWPVVEFLSDGDGRVYFRVGASSTEELWVSDGTVEGTAPVTFPETLGSVDSESNAWFGDAFLFTARLGDDWQGSLWVHDGVGPAARPLTLPPPDSRPWKGPITRLGHLLLFYVYDDDGYGYQMWRTDGTEGGTFAVSRFEPGQVNGGVAPGFDAGGTAIFELESYCNSLPPSCYWMTYVSDGTVEGSGIVDDLESVYSGSPWTAVQVPGGILVPARTGNGGTGIELGLIDLADRSLHLAADIEPQSGSTPFSALMSRGDELLALVREGSGAPRGWSIPAPFVPPQLLPVYGEDFPDVRAILNGNLVGIGWSWPAGSEIVSLSPNSSTWMPISPTVDLQPYGALEVVTHGPDAYFFERWTNQRVWRTDGTQAGTSELQSPGYYSSLVAATDTHLFFLEDGIPTVWYSHDLSSGVSTVLLHEAGPLTFRHGNEVASTDRGLYFTTTEFESVEWLRYSDGTAPGTAVVWSSVRDERVLDLFPVGEELYFLVGSEQLGLWRTRAGGPATRIADLGALAHDADDERPREFLTVGGRLFFVAESAATGTELWSTDGTAAGTSVIDLVPGAAGSDPRELAAVGDRVYFSADDGLFGREVWAVESDAGVPIRVSDIAAGPAGSGPERLTAAGSVLYFAADDGLHGRELWAIETAGSHGACEPDATRLCLLGGRFEVEAYWRDFSGRSGPASAAPLSESSGLFRFVDEGAVDLAVKMVDACDAPQFSNHWFYAAGLTNLEVTLSVLDVATLERLVFRNDSGRPFAPVRDTTHFASCGAPKGEAGLVRRSRPPVPFLGDDGGCVDSDSTLCLQDGRFEVTFDLRSDGGPESAARAVALSQEAGYFTFFDPGNVEAVVRLVDGCTFNGRYWLFAGGLTDLATRLRIRDTLDAGAEIVVEKPGGAPFQPILDIEAFEGCP